MMKRQLLVALACFVISHARGQTQVPAAPVPDAGKAPAQAVERWRADRFGMFIHWGPVSLTGKEIGWSRGAQTPIAEYDSLYKKFNPTKFNADEWVAIAKAAGMRYIVLTAKHHDGFCLWDSKFTDYDITATPFKRDVVAELAAACRKSGIRLGLYYSSCDWWHPDFPLGSPGGRTKKPGANLANYATYLENQVTELIRNYGPLTTVWFDVPQEYSAEYGIPMVKRLRELQPDIMINNRAFNYPGRDDAKSLLCDYSTPEQKIGSFDLHRPWESCMTVSAHNHWAWGGEKDGVKSVRDCLRMLVLGNGGDGNVLLNVGPTPEGIIAPEQADLLKEIGAWLGKYGESLHGTRGGPYMPTDDFTSTRKGNIIYLHILKGAAGSHTLPALPAKVTAATLLTGGSVDVTQTGQALTLQLTPQNAGEFDTIVKLTLDKPSMEIQPIKVTKTP